MLIHAPRFFDFAAEKNVVIHILDEAVAFLCSDKVSSVPWL